MSSHLIIDGNAVYEVDEDCMKGKYRGGNWRRGNQMQNNRKRAEGRGRNDSQDWGCCSEKR